MGSGSAAPILQNMDPVPPAAPPPLPIPDPIAVAELPKTSSPQQRNPQLDSIINSRKQAAAMAAGLGANGTVLTSPQGAGNKVPAALATAQTTLLGG